MLTILPLLHSYSISVIRASLQTFIICLIALGRVRWYLYCPADYIRSYFTLKSQYFFAGGGGVPQLMFRTNINWHTAVGKAFTSRRTALTIKHCISTKLIGAVNQDLLIFEVLGKSFLLSPRAFAVFPRLRFRPLAIDFFPLSSKKYALSTCFRGGKKMAIVSTTAGMP